MDGHLRKLRKAKGWTLSYVSKSLSDRGYAVSVGTLSILERGKWPTRELVDALVELFDGEISEMEILYPFRELDK